MDVIGLDGLRADGRRPMELRHIRCEIGSSGRCGWDGSATMQMGLSKAIVFLLNHSLFLSQMWAGRRLSCFHVHHLYSPYFLAE